MKNRSWLLLTFIIAVGAFFRFYKLDWGQGLFTHPDEYHIVISVNQLSFPDQMHPHFFSYGTVIIYLIFFTEQVLSFLSSLLHTPYSILLTLNPFLIGRFYSALFSTLAIPLVYLITKKITNAKYALIAAFLAAATPGLIQQAHFATPESTLIFFILTSLTFIIYFLSKNTLKYLVFASIFFGLALGVKVSSIVFGSVIILAIFIKFWKNWLKIPTFSLLSIFTAVVILFIVAPFIVLDFPAFKNNIEYEGGLAVGKFLVFYTRQFIDTVPILFQFEKIYPFTLGPSLLILGSLGFFLTFYYIVRKQQYSKIYLLLIVSFLSLFIPNAFLFAKWTRFASPTFPFFAIFTSFLLFQLSKIKLPFPIIHTTSYLLLVIHLLWALTFFSIYQNEDIRITASRWLEENTPPGSTLLVEGGNMIDIPLGGDFKKISLDFYDLENNSLKREEIASALEETDYFLIQSRRVFLNHQRLPQKFPQTAKFYDNLFSGSTGFKEIKQFYSYPSIQLGLYKWELPDENAEETWSVFDHPVIRVFQKEKQLTNNEYQQLFEE